MFCTRSNYIQGRKFSKPLSTRRPRCGALSHISDPTLRSQHVYDSQGVGYASPAKATARSLLFCHHYAASAPDALIELLANFCGKAGHSATRHMSKALRSRLSRMPDSSPELGPLCFLTAEFASDGQLAGFAAFRKLPAGREEAGNCQLCDVVVGPSYRKQGIGTSLVRHCLAVMATTRV